MKLEPFHSFGDTPFSASQADILALHGKPLKTNRNEVELNELDYGSVVFRFQDCGRLEEITQKASVVTFGKVVVPFAALHAFIQEQDPGMFEKAGFIISPRYGLAFVPGRPPWVTALAQHCLDSWRAI